MNLVGFARRTAPLWNMVSGVLTLAGLVGGGWAIWQYMEQKNAERQKYTLDLVGVWQEEGYFESYDRLAGNIVSFMAQVPKAQLDDARNNPDLKKRLQENLSRRLISDDGNLPDVKRVVYFFKWLDICLQQHLCSKDTAIAFFDDTVSTFVENYGTYVRFHQPLMPASVDILTRLSKELNENGAVQ